MIYLGNYKDWFKQEWINELLVSTGTPRPSQGKKPDSIQEEYEYSKARAAGYKDDQTYFFMFDKNNVSFEIKPPFIDGKFHWWITKMLPGNFMPVHRDPHTLYQANSKRYWMPLQDWEAGHIFVYEDKIITNYRAGDVWCYEDATALHGAANIGLTTRLILQVSTHG